MFSEGNKTKDTNEICNNRQIFPLTYFKILTKLLEYLTLHTILKVCVCGIFVSNCYPIQHQSSPAGTYERKGDKFAPKGNGKKQWGFLCTDLVPKN